MIDIAFARRGPHSTILVTEMKGRIVASAMVGEDGHRGWVYYVATDPEYQGTGLGKAIMAAAENWLRARGVWKVQLLVREGNDRVRQFYEHLGYRDTRSVCSFRRSSDQRLLGKSTWVRRSNFGCLA
jgi:ribosomal protein S18 acetylase RimI-like enzyme